MSGRRIDTYFDPTTGFALLELRKEDVGLSDQPIEFANKTFQPKEEVHITILGSNMGEQLAQKMRENSGLEEKLRQTLEETEWSYALQDEWYHIRREDEQGEAESIIRMVEVPALKQFYNRVAEMAGVEIPPRPAHVTLYTWNDPDGIGIATREQFKELVVSQLEPGELIA